ncbi:hypothetical protein [Peribacillus simplex]|uniref:hypothetical protein n=1 Tax=Peribacillus simplex TaxID=1478 RepID=UPI0028533CB0|nr:hypothetical protein [Peribacillus simplex]MDR4929417.1 hypothetical protein [Peribacillus simplex]
MASTVEYSAGQGVKRHLPSILMPYMAKRRRLRSNNGLAETPPDARGKRLGRRTVSAERKLNSETNWNDTTV